MPWWGWVIAYGMVALTVVYVGARMGWTVPEPPDTNSYDGLLAVGGILWPLFLPISLFAFAMSAGQERYEAAKKLADEREKELAEADRLLRREGILPRDDT